MEYGQRPPDPRLQPFVEALWTLSGSGRAELDPVFPDGRSELIVHRRTPFERVVSGRAPDRQAPLLFAGQMRSPAFLIPGSESEVIGVRFRPCGAAAFLSVPQHELVDEIVDVGAVSAPWMSALVARARDADTAEEAIAILERGLIDRLDRRASLPAGFEVASVAVARLVASRGRIAVERVALEVGLSRRQLERVFHSHVGVPPKLLARILRFQAALAAADRETTWSDAAAAQGYADQSHLIRDFRALAGDAPTRVLQQAGELTRAFLSR